jgi:hypothetical protein
MIAIGRTKSTIPNYNAWNHTKANMAFFEKYAAQLSMKQGNREPWIAVVKFGIEYEKCSHQ